MKDEMIKHALPPTVLVKLATITGKVFRRYDIHLDGIKLDAMILKVFRRFDILFWRGHNELFISIQEVEEQF